jgi:hypothetical protein
MNRRNCLLLLLLCIAGCLEKQRENTLDGATRQAAIDSSKYIDLHPWIRDSMNKKKLTPNGNYYLLNLHSDSMFTITWGNNKLQRTYEEPIDLMFLERLSVSWESKDYLVLDYSTGSNAWTNIVLPLNEKQSTQTYANALCFDKEYNLLVTENNSDTVLTIHNLKTLNMQYIVEKNSGCTSPDKTACLDTAIEIRNKVLYYRWITPEQSAKKQQSIERKVSITL